MEAGKKYRKYRNFVRMGYLKPLFLHQKKNLLMSADIFQAAEKRVEV